MTTTTISVRAPLKGRIVPLGDVPDPMFALGMMGDGVAIEPEIGEVRAPVDGTVTSVHRRAHAVKVQTDDGAELLVHVGLEAVALRGTGLTAVVAEGDRVAKGTVLATLEGRARALVSAERASLNFLQTLSGTATTTAAYVDAVRGTRAKILDTRKTIPGLRMAQKYAVRTGGGANHRIGLFDAVMLKENHIRAFGSVTAAIRAARAAQPALPLIVEVETLDQLREALAEGCDRILVDDFDAATRREAVRIALAAPFDGRVPLEVSGGVDLAGVRAIAEDGVDCISIGGLTKHVRAIDLSLKLGRRDP